MSALFLNSRSDLLDLRAASTEIRTDHQFGLFCRHGYSANRLTDLQRRQSSRSAWRWRLSTNPVRWAMVLHRHERIVIIDCMGTVFEEADGSDGLRRLADAEHRRVNG